MHEMLPVTDPRIVSTVKVLQEKLSNKGFLYRYLPEASEFNQADAVFITSTLWLVNLLAMMGRREEADELFIPVTESANHLPPFAEEFGTDAAEQTGHLPPS